jgi:NAD(P)-dependent dehydrogenase (short-subunit alcohol dehydrogenase family)
MRGQALGVHYSASKAGVLGMTRAMALALAPHDPKLSGELPAHPVNGPEGARSGLLAGLRRGGQGTRVR